MAILVDHTTRIVIQGITDKERSMVIRHSIHYGTKVVAGVSPGKGGQFVYGVPIFDSLRAACRENQVNCSLICEPPESVSDAVLEAIDNNIKLVLVSTVNLPVHDTLRILNMAKKAGIRLIGPNSLGVINPRDGVKLGALGGDNVERSFVPGHVGLISMSTGMTAETALMVKRAGFGISTCIGIGSDPLIGTTPMDLLHLFQRDEDTYLVVVFSEPGVNFDDSIADMLKNKQFVKPLIYYAAGRFLERMPEGYILGNPPPVLGGSSLDPSQKVAKLRGAGAYIADNYDDIIMLLQQVMVH